jgi:hypothetical protein
MATGMLQQFYIIEATLSCECHFHVCISLLRFEVFCAICADDESGIAGTGVIIVTANILILVRSILLCRN